MRHLDVVMHMNIVCVIVLGPISLIRFHAPFAIWIAYCFVDECWMNRNSVLCSICNAFCNCKLFDVSYSNKVIWFWTPLNSPHKGQSRIALIFSFICGWINGCVNSREAGHLRRHGAHYDVGLIYLFIIFDLSIHLLFIHIFVYLLWGNQHPKWVL